jgi:hypothetical protein
MTFVRSAASTITSLISCNKCCFELASIACWDLGVVGILGHVDQTLVPARRIEAMCHEPLHAELAHVAQSHGRAGRLLLLRCHVDLNE